MFSKIRGAWCMLASPADVLRGLSHVPAPLDQSQQTSRSGKCTLDLEEFRA